MCNCCLVQRRKGGRDRAGGGGGGNSQESTFFEASCISRTLQLATSQDCDKQLSITAYLALRLQAENTDEWATAFGTKNCSRELGIRLSSTSQKIPIGCPQHLNKKCTGQGNKRTTMEWIVQVECGHIRPDKAPVPILYGPAKHKPVDSPIATMASNAALATSGVGCNWTAVRTSSNAAAPSMQPAV